MSIDFENMKPGTLLLLDHDPYSNPNRVVAFEHTCNSSKLIDIRTSTTCGSCLISSVVCVVPPKPEIHGWEVVEFREPEGTEEAFQGMSGCLNCQGVMRMASRPFDQTTIGRRRWILKRKETEQVENFKQKEKVVPEKITINLLEKPMKEQTSFKTKLKSLLWWSVAPPALLAKQALFKSNWIGWTCLAAAVSWYAWLASTGQVEVPTLQSPLKW